ncbi:Grx4 family monothiol glutaredoxin [Buchnera aphidicola (Brachycaudus cardui)]|uniref:Glutaredoxin n=1 Tax=Buchnera aphidicola (Brachycaudus cardui) TaxID=557993 RepID=A0A4D6XWW6_9GAMM|nr:Grx4 family monothiol glutaredoxin [Buchnera aphidicola]QCI20337.1 Grx4 family monothiol glutaredoxin [Buchnera aphidicola (Brachycaudus cardui)]
MNVIQKIEQQIKDNIILIYMKGTPEAPSCGFSAQAVRALSVCGEKFAYVDVLENTDIRNELPKYANWPTFPQLWIDGKLIGGCSIILEMLESGDLKKIILDTVKKYQV